MPRLQDRPTLHKTVMFSGFLYKGRVQTTPAYRAWGEQRGRNFLCWAPKHETQATSYIWAIWGLKGAKKLWDKREGMVNSGFQGLVVCLGSTRPRWEAACSQLTSQLTSTSVGRAGTTRHNADSLTGNFPAFFLFPPFFIERKGYWVPFTCQSPCSLWQLFRDSWYHSPPNISSPASEHQLRKVSLQSNNWGSGKQSPLLHEALPLPFSPPNKINNLL